MINHKQEVAYGLSTTTSRPTKIGDLERRNDRRAQYLCGDRRRSGWNSGGRMATPKMGRCRVG